MANLKDLLVNGPSNLIGDVTVNKIRLTSLEVNNGTTYDPGSNGQVLKSNGTSVYWSDDNNSITGVKGNAENSYRTGNVNITQANIIGSSTIGTDGIPIYWNGSAFSAGKVTFDSLTGNRLAWTAGLNKIYAGNHYADNTKIAINKTTVPSENFYVNGTSFFNGLITVKSDIATDGLTSGALNMNNSNIYNLNSIYTANKSDTASQGIHFYRDSTHVDSLWINNGDILFVPNRSIGTSTTKNDSQKVARFTENPTSNYLVITAGTTGGIKSTRYLNTHPENTGIIIPFIYNDLAFLKNQGGSYKCYKVNSGDYTSPNLYNLQTAILGDSSSSDSTLVTYLDNCFNGCPNYKSNIDSTTNEILIIDIRCPKAYSYTTIFYIDFGSYSFRAKNIQLYTRNAASSNDTSTPYTLLSSTDNNTLGNWYASKNLSSPGINEIRFVLTDWAVDSINAHRISQIGLINFDSDGVRRTLMSRGIDDPIYRSITPKTTNVYDLGSNNNKWANIYATNFIGNLTGNANTATSLSNTSKIGDTNKPVYFTAEGVPSVISYTIDKSVPSNAVFTDTKNTAGSTNTSSRIFLIGATTQTENSQTFSDDEVYVTNGTLYLTKNSKGLNISSLEASQAIVTDSEKNLVSRGITNNSGNACPIGWINNATSNLNFVTVNSIAYWDGCYNGTNSNLTYLKGGYFDTNNHFIPKNNASQDLGNENCRWNKLYVNEFAPDNIINNYLITFSDSWQTIQVNEEDFYLPLDGTYIVQIIDDSHPSGGSSHWHTYWSGIFSWYSDRVNGSGEYTEIPLHGAGHAINKHSIQLRTYSPLNATHMKLQIKGNHETSSNTANNTLTIKFKHIM